MITTKPNKSVKIGQGHTMAYVQRFFLSTKIGLILGHNSSHGQGLDSGLRS